jgi:hypothetical protein
MRPLICLRLLPALAIAIAILLTPAQPGHGQDTPPQDALLRGNGQWVARPSAVPAPVVFATAPVTGTELVYLPLVARSAGIGIQFGSGLDAQNNLIDAGTVFAFGITHLYYRYTLESAAGHAYRAEWTVAGARQPQLDDSGTIPPTPAVFTRFFCSLTLGPCGPPLPRGIYQVKFFIDNVFQQEIAASIE